MIRWESVIIAVFGTTGGLIAPTFSAPVGQLVVLLVVGAVAGVLAGLRPARRAAKLPVLQAVTAE